MNLESIDSLSNIIWVDSNPKINQSLELLLAANMRVACFHETADALKALRQRKLNIKNLECVITSMMEGGGRKERGFLNGLQMLDSIKQMVNYVGQKEKPIFAVVSPNANVKECKKHEVDIIVFGNYKQLHLKVINELEKRRRVSTIKRVIFIGIAGPSGCGKSKYARHLAECVGSPFPVISLESYSKGSMKVDHRAVGQIQSWEDPLTVDIERFYDVLRKIKSDWKHSELLQVKETINRQTTIIVIVKGFVLFSLSDEITSIFNIRIFFDSTVERCRLGRYRRENNIDQNTPDAEVVVPPEYTVWYDNLVWSEYLKRRDEQMMQADKVFDLIDTINAKHAKIDEFIDQQLRVNGYDNIEQVNNLANELDEIDRKYGDSAVNPGDKFYNKRVREKHDAFNKLKALIPLVLERLVLSTYLLSPSYGYQSVAIEWIHYKKDASQVNVLCYILLNSTSNFLKYHLMKALFDITDQFSIEQIEQVQRSLAVYKETENTGQATLKSSLLQHIGSLLTYSISDIILDSYLWRDVENKFYHSLSGVTKYRLKSLYAIRNASLFKNFNDCRRSFVGKDSVLYVYHGSSADGLRMIAKHGFREPDSKASDDEVIKALDGGYFGRGIYHGYAADYAILYSERYRKSNEILLSAVLPGRSYSVKKGGEKFGEICEPGYDSHVSPEKKELVIFRSEQILPLFIIEFMEIPHSDVFEEPL